MAFLTLFAGGQNKVTIDPNTKLFNFDFTTKDDIIQLPNSEISYSLDLNVQQKDRSTPTPLISVNGLKGFPFTLNMDLNRQAGETYHTAVPLHIKIFARLLELMKNTKENDVPLIVPLFWCPRLLDNGYFDVTEFITDKIPPYQATIGYRVGDEVTLNDKFYLCKEEYIPVINFNPSDWTELTDDLFVLYDKTQTYDLKDLVKYNNKKYICQTKITTPEPFNPDKWNLFTQEDVPAFNNSKIYRVKDLVNYEDKNYRCIVQTTLDNTFDATKWDEFTIDNPQPKRFYNSDINAINEIFYEKGNFEIELEYLDGNQIKTKVFNPYCVPVALTNLPTKEDIKNKSKFQLKGIFVTDVE